MNLNLYDKDMNRISVIGNQFVSCLWSEGYNSTGNFTLELIDTDEYKKKANIDCYVGRTDRKPVMVVKSVQFKDGRIILSGKQATRILDDVALLGTINKGVYIDNAVANAYNLSSKYRGLSFAATNIGVASTHQISNQSFLAACNSLCADTDLGITVERSGASLVAKFYKPEINENLIFAKKYGNLSDPSITVSSEAYKNYAIVLGMDTGSNRVSTTVDITNGADRRELVIDARDLQMESGETQSGYRRRLAERGLEKLLENQEIFSCVFTPYSGDFGKKYDLGDMLTVNLDEYGLKLQARVIKFTQKSQSNRTETQIEVGKVTIVR